METTDLTNLLPLTNSTTVLFTADTVPGATLATQLSKLAGGLPLTISGATRKLENNTLEVSGLVGVLGQPNIPVTLSATVVPAPEMLQLQAVFQLNNAQLPLQTLWQRLGLPDPRPDYVPANLSLYNLTLHADRTGSFWLEAQIAPTPGWPLEIGPTQLMLANVKLAVRRPSGGQASIRFSGELNLGDALRLAMDCDTTGSFSMGAQLSATTPRKLVKSVTQQDLPAVRAFDVPLDKGSVAISREKTGLALTATGTIGGIGLLLQARRAGAGTWGYALGLSLDDNTPLDLPALEQVRQLCRLQSLLLVAASYEDAGFALASLVAPTSATSGKKLALTGGLQPGLTAYASWWLDGDGNQKLLRQLMPALPNGLAVLLHLNETLTGGRMAAGATFAFNQASSNPLTFVGEFGCEIEAGKAELFLSGSMQTKLPGQPGQPDQVVQFAVDAEFLPTGLLISGSMVGTANFATLPVSLSNLAVVVGVNEAGVPSLGLAGTLAVQKFQSSVAVFFDSNNPSRSLLAGSVSNLNLLDVLQTFTPGAQFPSSLASVLKTAKLTGTLSITITENVEALVSALRLRQLDKLAKALRPRGVRLTNDVGQALLVAGRDGNTWFLTDLSTAPPVHYELTRQGNTLTISVNPQLYFAPQDTQLGRLQFAQGLLISAKLQLLAFEAQLLVKASLSQGLLAEGSMSRIIVGAEALFSITAESDSQKGPLLSIATFSPPPTPQAQAQNQARDQAIQAAQGTLAQTQAQFAAAQTAYTTALAKLTSGLGSVIANRDKAEEARMRMQVLQGALTMAQQTLTQLLDQAAAAQADPRLKPHFLLNGKVTVFGIQRGIYASISDKGIEFQLTGTLEPGVTCDLRGYCTSFSNAGVSGTLRLGADGLVVDLGRLGQANLNTGVQGTLVLRLEPASAASVRTTAGFEKISAQALGQLVTLPALTLNTESPSLDSIRQQVLAQLKPKLLSFLTNASAWLGYLKAGWLSGAQEVVQTLRDTFGVRTPEAAAKLLGQAGYAADQIAHGLSTAYGLTQEQLCSVLNTGGYAIDQVSGMLQRVYQADLTTAAGLLRRAGYATSQVYDSLLSVYQADRNAALRAFHAAGYGINEVGNFIKNNLNSNINEVAKALQAAAYNCGEIGQFLRDNISRDAGTLAGALKAAGYGIGDIGNFLKNNIRLGYKDVARALKSAGYGVNDLLGYIRNSFSLSFTDLAGLPSFIKGLF